MPLTSSPMSFATAVNRRCSSSFNLSVKTRFRPVTGNRIVNVLRIVNVIQISTDNFSEARVIAVYAKRLVPSFE